MIVCSCGGVCVNSGRVCGSSGGGSVVVAVAFGCISSVLQSNE